MLCHGHCYRSVFLKEYVTYLSNERLVLKKLDPRDQLVIRWIPSVFRHISVCRLGCLDVVVIEKTGGILIKVQ